MIPGTDLASRWLGGSVVAASDESFGEKENLLSPAPAAFEPGHYGPRGEIVDGWETRRRRSPGHDWAIIRLGAPGIITLVDVDTSFFTGNFPQSVGLEACGCEGYPAPGELTGWEPIVPRSPLTGDGHNHFPVTDGRRFTHVRLAAFPDGGIARLRVFGQVVPDPRGLEELTLDLASQQYGGAVVATSDDFYTSAAHLIRPDRARTMGEGWETRRRRDGGHDHVVIRLAFPGLIRRIVLDTAHFKYNASAEVTLSGSPDDPAPAAEPGPPDDPGPAAEPGAPDDPGPPDDPGSADVRGSAADPSPLAGAPAWRTLLARTRLQPDTRHECTCQDQSPVTLVRLDAYPDGGLSRVRLIGRIDPHARRAAGYRWFNSLPATQAVQCLLDAGLEPDLAAQIADRRPLASDWRVGLPGPLARYQPLTTMLEGHPG